MLFAECLDFTHVQVVKIFQQFPLLGLAQVRDERSHKRRPLTSKETFAFSSSNPTRGVSLLSSVFAVQRIEDNWTRAECTISEPRLEQALLEGDSPGEIWSR
jgi:hypothetical protein